LRQKTGGGAHWDLYASGERTANSRTRGRTSLGRTAKYEVRRACALAAFRKKTRGFLGLG